MIKRNSYNIVNQKIERAIIDLKTGFVVEIHDDSSSFLVSSYETVIEDFSKELGEPFGMVMSATRANYLFSENFEHGKFITIKASNFDHDLLKTITMSLNPIPSAMLKDVSFTESTELESLSVKLLKITDLTPTAVIYKNQAEDAVSLNSHEILSYKTNIAHSLKKVSEAKLSLKYVSDAEIYAFRAENSPKEHYAIVIGDLSKAKVPTARIHSSCFTGDLLASLACDCGDQLSSAISYMNSDPENAGVILYMMQEGRDIGLANKIRTYNLQQQGFDTVDANEFLGFASDERHFEAAAEMLSILGIKEVRLLSNNPRKSNNLSKFGIKVAERIPLIIQSNAHNKFYLATKASRLGHDLPNHRCAVESND